MGYFVVLRSCGHEERKMLGAATNRQFAKRVNNWLRTPCNACRKAGRIAERAASRGSV